MLKSHRGIVITQRPYEERHCIIEMLSSDGIITGFVRQGRDPRSPLFHLTHLFQEETLVLYSQKPFWGSVKEGTIHNRFSFIEEPSLFFIASKSIQFARCFSLHTTSTYSPLVETIKQLKTATHPSIPYAHFVLSLLKNEGMFLPTMHCAQCGSWIQKEGGLIAGTIQCDSCLSNVNYLPLRFSSNQLQQLCTLTYGSFDHPELQPLSNSFLELIEKVATSCIG